MMPRTLAALIAASMLMGATGFAQAQSDNERAQMLFGGAPRAKNYNFFGFGGSSVRLRSSTSARSE